MRTIVSRKLVARPGAPTCRPAGPTVFLPGTHTEACHAQFNGPENSKHTFLAGRTYVTGRMAKGDAAIMDSRLLHCGGANASGRRALLVFSLYNDGEHHAEGGGSMWADMCVRLAEFCAPGAEAGQAAATDAATAVAAAPA